MNIEENCDGSFVAIYNGFASPFEKAAEKLCKIRGKKEFKSKGFRLGVRFNLFQIYIYSIY